MSIDIAIKQAECVFKLYRNEHEKTEQGEHVSGTPYHEEGVDSFPVSSKRDRRKEVLPPKRQTPVQRSD